MGQEGRMSPLWRRIEAEEVRIVGFEAVLRRPLRGCVRAVSPETEGRRDNGAIRTSSV